MFAHRSIDFFDEQFRRQLQSCDLELNPFERLALPHLRGDVLDYGCGLGNLALQAARLGCRVLALDASPVAIAHLQALARREALAIEARVTDLRHHVLTKRFDTVVCIGLLMFFDCAAAFAQLEQLKAQVRAGGIAVVNVLTDGTTYLDMFDPGGYCLFRQTELREHFDGWELLEQRLHAFDAPGGTRKVFATVVARRAQAAAVEL